MDSRRGTNGPRLEPSSQLKDHVVATHRRGLRQRLREGHVDGARLVQAMVQRVVDLGGVGGLSVLLSARNPAIPRRYPLDATHRLALSPVHPANLSRPRFREPAASVVDGFAHRVRTAVGNGVPNASPAKLSASRM